MNIFKLPDLGEGLQDAEIVAWHVSAGDHVVADQPLVSVETDKAVVEIPSPRSGNVTRLCAEVGDIVDIGADLVEFDDQPRADPGAIVGSLESDKDSVSVRASPAVRRLAREREIDLGTITGTGPDGAITTADLEGAGSTSGDDVKVERISGVRRAMAASMARAGREVVAATVTESASVSHWSPDCDLMIRVIRAIEAGLSEEPGLNAWYKPALGERWIHSRLDLGIAVDTPDGLFAPVLRDTTNRSDSALREGLERLRADVRDRSIPAAELRGQTFTLSNFGAIAGLHAALVIVPPQVAILGVGRKHAPPGIPESSETAAAHRVIPLSLTFDHRVVSGGEAARFLRAVVHALEG